MPAAAPQSTPPPPPPPPPLRLPPRDPNLTVHNETPKQLAEDVFVIEGHLRALPAVRLPVRMTILRDRTTSSLILYSPLHPAHYADLSPLGTVRAIIAPAAMHSLYVPVALHYYPQAVLYSTPALAARHPTRDWGTVVTPTTSPDVLCDSVRMAVVAALPSFAEVVLLHVPSRTLVLCDLAFNLSPDTPPLQHSSWLFRFYMRVSGGQRPLDTSGTLRSFLAPKAAALVQELHALLQWDFDRVVVCHGDVVEKDGKRMLDEGLIEGLRRVAAKNAEPRTAVHIVQRALVVTAVVLAAVAVLRTR